MARWTAVEVFGDDSEHLGSCCNCCEGYCPREDGSSGPVAPVLYEVGPYLSDKYVAIRADLVEALGENVLKPKVHKPATWTVPDSEPPTSSGLFLPSRAARLTALGLHIRGDDKPSHLYLDGEHVGYLMGAEKGRTLDEITALDRMVKALDERRDSNARALMKDIGEEDIDALMVVLEVADDLRALRAEAGV